MTDPTDRDREMAEGYYHDADPLYRLDAVPRLAKLFREARAEGRRAAFRDVALEVCWECHQGSPLVPDKDGYWWHDEHSLCTASAIHSLAAKEQT